MDGLCVLAVSALCLLGPVSSQVVETPPILYLHGDTLIVDVVVDSLFSPRANDAIASGMSTSIIHQFRLTGEGVPTIVQSVVIQLHHDIWEDRYTVIRSDRAPDTLTTDTLSDVRRAVSELSATPIGRLGRSESAYRLALRSRVDLISPEQERRTRRWLNLLERGSILELFFSLAPREQDISWSEIARFNRSDLPQEPPFAPSSDRSPNSDAGPPRDSSPPNEASQTENLELQQ